MKLNRAVFHVNISRTSIVFHKKMLVQRVLLYKEGKMASQKTCWHFRSVFLKNLQQQCDFLWIFFILFNLSMTNKASFCSKYCLIRILRLTSKYKAKVVIFFKRACFLLLFRKYRSITVNKNCLLTAAFLIFLVYKVKKYVILKLLLLRMLFVSMKYKTKTI